jgi:hypothetical protein
MYATPSAQAADAARKHPPNRISNRLRNIAPSSARGHAEPLQSFIGPADVLVKWHEGQHFPTRYWTKGQVA